MVFFFFGQKKNRFDGSNYYLLIGIIPVVMGSNPFLCMLPSSFYKIGFIKSNIAIHIYTSLNIKTGDNYETGQEISRHYFFDPPSIDRNLLYPTVII